MLGSTHYEYLSEKNFHIGTLNKEITWMSGPLVYDQIYGSAVAQL